MKSYKYNDGMLHGGRVPTLWLVKSGEIFIFEGKSIDGVCTIIRTEFEKNGRWSNTTYFLALDDKTTPCYLVAPMHGKTWPEGTRREAYERFCREFKVSSSFAVFDAALGREFPKARTRMMETEESLAALEEQTASDVEVVKITTYKPCNRNPHHDVLITSQTRKWLVAHEAPIGTKVDGVFEVVEREHVPGYRGGDTTLVIAIADVVSVEIYAYPKDASPFDFALGRNGDGIFPERCAVEVQLTTQERKTESPFNNPFAVLVNR